MTRNRRKPPEYWEREHMGVMERTAWIDHVNALSVPEWLKEQMRQQVVAHDQLLSRTLGDMELIYYRTRQQQPERPQ